MSMATTEPVIFTSRLKLNLITQAEKGSKEFEWLHALRADEKATWWSISGRSKTFEDTEKAMKEFLPVGERDPKAYRVVYAVHLIIGLRNDGSGDSSHYHQHVDDGKIDDTTEFIGLITLKSLGPSDLPLPEHLTIPTSSTTLVVEVAYSFLPAGWGQGYATESVAAVFEASREAQSFWSPFSKLYVRAIVNGENPLSMRVMDKTGMQKTGVYELTNRPVFLAGELRVSHSLHIYGRYLIE